MNRLMRIPRFLYTKIIQGLSRIFLSILSPRHIDILLRIWCDAPNNIRRHPTSQEEWRRLLAFWFSVQKHIDDMINRACSEYYHGKHPKHYLWKEHNRYIFDHIHAGDNVLDVGCGASQYTQWIAEKAKHVLGVDLRPARVEISQENNQCPNVHFEVMDVTKSLPDATFDVAICSHVIEHLDDPEAFLSALSLKIPRIIIKVPLVDAHWMKMVKADIGLDARDDLDHRREYTEELLRETLDHSGWHITELIRGADLRCEAYSKHVTGNKSNSMQKTNQEIE